MHTAEEYFAALEEHLKEMPAEERAETITYYREYAQEGGLLDADQLREHFGPPEALAARILEDNAGKRSQNTPLRTGRESRRLIAVLLGIFVVLVALGSVLVAALSPKTEAVTTGTVSQSEAESPGPTAAAAVSDTAKADGALPLQGDTEVAPFTDMVINVVSAQIQVEIGDRYALRYDLCDQEVVDRVGVEGQTLYLVSHSKSNQQNSSWYGEVCITVPADAALGSLQFSTVSGGVTVPELSCRSVDVDNVSGDSVLHCTVENDVRMGSTSGAVQFDGQCRQLEVNTTSGRLTFAGKADAVQLNTVLGKFDFTGTADSVEMDSVSGSARIEGTVTEQVRVDMVSGNIDVTAADPTVTAEGKQIDYNGQRMADDSWSRQGSGCTLTLKTAAGSVSVRTP